ncbi:MAG: hypothetical protein ACREVL_03145 [Solimonas sp.]
MAAQHFRHQRQRIGLGARRIGGNDLRTLGAQAAGDAFADTGRAVDDDGDAAMQPRWRMFLILLHVRSTPAA